MRPGTLELKECSVAVTAVSVVLTVVSVDGKTYTVAMPRHMGEALAVEQALELDTQPALKLAGGR